MGADRTLPDSGFLRPAEPPEPTGSSPRTGGVGFDDDRIAGLTLYVGLRIASRR
jgi:hypothetical protein